jgi:uncharacterized protein (DUF1499 family)
VRRRRRVMTVALGIVVGAAILMLAIRLYMSRDAEGRAAAAEIVDFAKLGPPDRDNSFVLCPPELCPSSALAPSPTFNMKWERLRDYWQEMVAMQPRIELVAKDAGGRQFTYVQRSAVFRFPDVVTVAFMPVGDARSTLAVLSRSRYGRRDFGVNAARIDAWMAMLQQMMRDNER